MTREYYGVTAEAQGSINKLLSLSASRSLQDWELGVTTVGKIRAVGGNVISTPGIGHHVTVRGVSGEAASPVFQKIVKNPNPLKSA